MAASAASFVYKKDFHIALVNLFMIRRAYVTSRDATLVERWAVYLCEISHKILQLNSGGVINTLISHTVTIRFSKVI